MTIECKVLIKFFFYVQQCNGTVIVFKRIIQSEWQINSSDVDII